MKNDFVIGKVGWLIEIERNYVFDVKLCYQAFGNIIYYLQFNGLTTRVILLEDEPVTEETYIKSSDLTLVGLLLVKKCFDKWIDNVIDQKIQATNYEMLDSELKKIRLKQ